MKQRKNLRLVGPSSWEDSMFAGGWHSPIFKVVGVGGAGNNFVENMIRTGESGAEYICCDTDHRALMISSASVKLHWADTKYESGDQEAARRLATADRARIVKALTGAKVAFITAGIGGGTGTGAAPVVADIAREMGILSVALVTKPFEFETKRAQRINKRIFEIGRHVDALVVVSNDRCLGADDRMGLWSFTDQAKDQIAATISGIIEIESKPGLVNVAFEDIKQVITMSDGLSVTGSAIASGPDRAQRAVESAMKFPLMDNFNPNDSYDWLINVTGSNTMGLREFKDVLYAVREYTKPEATVVIGAVLDDAMEDQLRVTVVGIRKMDRNYYG